MLEYGMRSNSDVEALQRDLNMCRSALNLPVIAVDGDFYGETYNAVCDLQRLAVVRGLRKPDGSPYTNNDVDGIAGPDTRAIIAHLEEQARPRVFSRDLLNIDAPRPVVPTRAADDIDWVPGISFASLDLPNFRLPEIKLDEPPLTTGMPTYAAGSVTMPPVDRPVARLMDVPEPATIPQGPIPRPTQLQIYPADILEPKDYAAVMRRARMRPEQRDELVRGLTELAGQLNQLDPSVRGSATLAARDMYLKGHPVTMGRGSARSGANSLDAQFVPLNNEDYNRGDMREIARTAERYGLQTEVGDDDVIRVSVDKKYERLSDLKRDLEAEFGDKKILPIYPVRMSDCRLNSNFGLRIDPITHRRGSPHMGIDIAPPTPNQQGLQVVSVMPGKVLEVQHSRWGYGNQVLVEDIYGVKHRYGHLARIDVKPGDVLQQGDQLGIMGSTGRSTGVHLHYERIERNGQKVDPTSTLDPERTTPIRAIPRQLKESVEKVIDNQMVRMEAAAKAAREAAEKAAKEAREEAARRAKETKEAIDKGVRVVGEVANTVGSAVASGWRSVFGRG